MTISCGRSWEKKIKIQIFKKRTNFFWKNLLLVLSMWKLALGYGWYHMHQIQLWGGGTKNLYESSCQVWSSTTLCVVRANP